MNNLPDKPHRSLWDFLKEPKREPSPPSLLRKMVSNKVARCEKPVLPGALNFDPNSVCWAMRNVPAVQATKHFLTCGMTGSGKSISTQLYLQSIAPRFLKTSPTAEQLIVYDPKCDMIPLLGSMGLDPNQDNVWILNPYDERAAEWNIAEDVQTPGMAFALATLLIPEEKNSTAPYFTDGARHLTQEVVMVFNAVAGTSWTFRDLHCGLSSRERIAALLARSPGDAQSAATILNEKRHSAAVLSTIATKLGPFKQVAALWHNNKNGRKFSAEGFFQKPGVLILGDDPVLHESIWPMNALLLKVLTNEILRSPNTLQPRHWFVLDEFPAMQRVDCIHDLINRGRSKGASVLLGIQSVEGLYKHYEEHGTNDILSQCACKTFFRAGGPKTAEWIADYFGKVRRIETVVTETSTSDGDSTSTQYALNERPMFLPSFFSNLPLPEEHGPFVAVCDVPYCGYTLIVRRDFDEVLSWCRDATQAARDFPGLKPRRDVGSQILEPWTEEEEIRFCGARVTKDLANETIRPSPQLPSKPKLPPRHDIDG